MSTPKKWLVFIACALAVSAARAETKLKFAVTPEGKDIGKKWEPVVKALSEKTGLPLQLVVEPSYDTFYSKYGKGSYDFALINPLSYARKAPKGTYTPIARKEGKLQGIVVVAKSSPVQALKDLRGKKIAYPSEDSYAATILNKLDLEREGVNSEDGGLYAGSHEKAYEMLLAGKVDAAGGVMRTFLQLKPEDSARLRILHTGTPVVSHPFVARASLPAGAVEKMKTALIGMGATPEGLAALKSVGMGALVPATEADYANLEK